MVIIMTYFSDIIISYSLCYWHMLAMHVQIPSDNTTLVQATYGICGN